MSDNDNDRDWWNFSYSEARGDLEISNNDRTVVISDKDSGDDWWNFSNSEARGRGFRYAYLIMIPFLSNNRSFALYLICFVFINTIYIFIGKFSAYFDLVFILFSFLLFLLSNLEVLSNECFK